MSGPWEDYQTRDAGPWAEYQAPAAPKELGALASASKALEVNIPFMDRAVAGAKTYLPQGYGGTGQDYAANLATEKAKNAAFEEQNPVTSAVGGLTAYAPAALIGGGATLPARVAAQGLTGLGIGALQGASSSPDLTNTQDTGQRIAQGELTGGALGAAIPAVAHGVGAVVNPLAAALRGGPGKAEIANLGNDVSAAYKRVNDLGASYTPEAYQGLVDKIASDAQAARINPGLHPGASGVISDMQKAAASGKPIDLPVLDQDRQIAWRDAAGKPDAGERQFGGMIRKNIDEFIAGAPPESMASGTNPADAASAIQNARDLAMRQFKANTLSEALDKASIRADTTGSYGNIENTTRQRLAGILEKEPWSKDELAQLNTMIHGTPVTNSLAQLSRFGPKGNALMMALELGAMGTGNPILMAAGAGGMAAQGTGALMRRNAQGNLLSTILAGGTRPEAQKAISGNYPRAALAAALAGNADLQSQRR